MIKKIINNIKEKHKKDKEEYQKLTYFEKCVLRRFDSIDFSIFIIFLTIFEILCFLVEKVVI